MLFYTIILSLMKRNTTKLAYLIMFSICTSFFIIGGCKKTKQDPAPATSTPPEVQTATDNAQSDFIFNNINNIVDDAARSEGGVNKMLGCATITKDSTANNPTGNYFPKTLVIDYGSGSTSCTGVDGRKRTGIISATFSGPRNVDSTITIDYSTYAVDGIKITGRTIVTTTQIVKLTTVVGTVTSVPIQWSTVTTASLVLNGVTHSWKCNKTRYWQQGSNTATQYDQFNFWGTSIRDSDTTLVQDITCLETFPTCPYIVRGTATISNGSKRIVINYGGANDVCDSKATISINGGTPISFILK